MLYFAYGSNMDWGQIRKRCPSVRFVGVAKLPDYRLAFTRKSTTRNCGVADAVRCTGHEVWGAVFEVPSLEIGTLDESEGFRPGRETNSYWRRECVVLLDGDNGRPLTVAAYFGEPQENPPPPSRAYKDVILAGARHWHLPADYIQQLESLEVAE